MDKETWEVFSSKLESTKERIWWWLDRKDELIAIEVKDAVE